MMTDVSDQLKAAARAGQLLRLELRFEDSNVRGYILNIGPEFFLLAVVSDRLWFDGFECFRLEDVESVEPDPYGRFAEAALAARGEVRGELKEISLASLEEILLSAAARFPLVTIHKDLVKPDVCYVGRILSVEGGIVWMLSIDPDAVWDTEPLAHKLADITHVGFGADYEGALHLVGGEPSKAAHQRPVPLRLITNSD